MVFIDHGCSSVSKATKIATETTLQFSSHEILQFKLSSSAKTEYLKGALRLKFWWIVKELRRRFEEGIKGS